MSRNLFSVIALVSGALLISGLAAAQPTSPNLSGSWQMDVAKSHVADGRTVDLAITQKANGVKLDGVIEKASVKTELHFDCKSDGSDCEFLEGAHKSKVSIWFTGGTLTACKTDGPSGDAVSEWHIKLSPDASSLTIEVEHVDPTAALETMVFTKKIQ